MTGARPAPHDVRAHLRGGLPKREIETIRPHAQALGFDVDTAFVHRDAVYIELADTVEKRADIRALVEADAGVATRRDERSLPSMPAGLRRALLDSFEPAMYASTEECRPDRFTARGCQFHPPGALGPSLPAPASSAAEAGAAVGCWRFVLVVLVGCCRVTVVVVRGRSF